MKVGYIGNFYKIPEFILHSEFELTYVIVESEKMSNEMMTFLLVRNIPFFEVKNGNELINVIKKTGISVWITCSYGKRIPIEKMNGIKIYNIHYSSLPLYKGRHPTFYATMANELEIGVSIHEITSKLDKGTVVAQKNHPYYIWENENNLFDKLTESVPQLLAELILFLKDRRLHCKIRNVDGFYYSPVTEKDFTIDIEKDSPSVIYNKVRAQAKYMGALVLWKKKEYYVNSVFFSKKTVSDRLCIPKDDYFVVMEAYERK